MKILSWNLERPNNSPKSIKNAFIIDLIKKNNPDIIFLTETNAAIAFNGYFCHQSLELPNTHENQLYKSGENRVAIFSKFPIVRIIETYDVYTAICCEINSAFETLVLYGSIIGSFGGKDAFFKNDLRNQQQEIESLSRNHNLIYSGDLNISFSGFPYPNKNVIAEMNDFFRSNSLCNLTSENENSAIHIIVSQQILEHKEIQQEMIAIAASISDHNLIVAQLR